MRKSTKKHQINIFDTNHSIVFVISKLIYSTFLTSFHKF